MQKGNLVLIVPVQRLETPKVEARTHVIPEFTTPDTCVYPFMDGVTIVRLARESMGHSTLCGCSHGKAEDFGALIG